MGRYVMGIDIGGTITKIVGLCDGTLLSPMQVRATDPLASVYGAFGKFVSENSLAISDVERVMVTGAGASFIRSPLYGLPTGRAIEFNAIGLGGLYLSKLSSAIVVSMGTGTAYVKAQTDSARHIGGTGVGGGTLLGLADRMINVREFKHIVDIAEGGTLDTIDLTVEDISKDNMPSLPAKITASNFGKMSDVATNHDIALGIFNLVFQTIGMMAVFACRADGDTEVVLTGNLTTIRQARDIFDVLNKMYGINFHIPEHAVYSTALGAALSYSRGWAFDEITGG